MRALFHARSHLSGAERRDLALAWGSAPGFVEGQRISAESAIHFRDQFDHLEEEYRELLRKHGVDFDERYMCD